MNGQQTANRSAPWHPYSPSPRRPRRPPLLLALAGVVALVLVAGLVWAGLHWWGSRSDAPVQAGPKGSEAVATRAPQSVPDAPAKAGRVGLGTVAKDGGFAFKVTKVRPAVRSVGPLRAGAGEKFIVVSVTVKNLQQSARPLLPTVQRMNDRSGQAFTPTAAASRKLWSPVPAGGVVAGFLVYEVPKGTIASSLELHGSAGSPGLDVKLRTG